MNPIQEFLDKRLVVPRPCNKSGPLRRQACIVGPQARQTDPGCARCSQLSLDRAEAVWFEDAEQ